MNQIKTCHMSDEELEDFLATRTESRRPACVTPFQRDKDEPTARDRQYFRGGFGRRSRKQMHRIAA